MIDKFEKYNENFEKIAKNTQKNDNFEQNSIKNSQNSLEKAETGLAIFMENLLPATYFLYTLNPYPKNIEANLPPLEERIESFKKLSKYCPVIWRYDPILLADGIDAEWHKKQFEKLDLSVLTMNGKEEERGKFTPLSAVTLDEISENKDDAGQIKKTPSFDDSESEPFEAIVNNKSFTSNN